MHGHGHTHAHTCMPRGKHMHIHVRAHTLQALIVNDTATTSNTCLVATAACAVRVCITYRMELTVGFWICTQKLSQAEQPRGSRSNASQLPRRTSGHNGRLYIRGCTFAFMARK